MNYRYGDKTPKSTIGRLFSVVWIIIGITICSILTATLSSALTNVTVEKYDVITGLKVYNTIRNVSHNNVMHNAPRILLILQIGAARDSIALKKAVNLGANAKG